MRVIFFCVCRLLRQSGKNLYNPAVCQICGDSVGLTVSGDMFVACNECAYPVCRPCYEYERKEGSRACPQCRTFYKRLKGERAALCVFTVIQ